MDHEISISQRFVVTGHVQGVGFRNFVASLAGELGLAGEVWNRRDGSVEAIAEGTPSALALFRDGLSHGPGRVESIASDDAPSTGQTYFSICETR